MAVAFVKAHTVVFNKTAGGTTVAPVLASAVPVGGLLVMLVVFDNAATASKPVVSSIGKETGETNNWVFLGAARSTSTSAGAFASGELWAIKTSVIWPFNGFYTVTLDTGVAMKAAQLAEFSGVEPTLRSTVGSAYSTTTTAAAASTTGTAPVVGDLAIGLMFHSNAAGVPAPDTDTVGGAWSTGIQVGSTGGSAATNNYGAMQYKIVTSTAHQSFSGSSTNAGNGSVVAVLQATPDPLVTQAAYRVYADGTETGSTALAAQDTAPAVDLSGGDALIGLRIRLQETNAGVVPTTDDWQLQWEKNASGTWTNVDAGTPTVVSYDSPNLTDGATIIGHRLTGGTGTANGGEVSETGLITDRGFGANSCVELLYSLALLQASLADGDTLRFRVLRNGATTSMTYSQTPTITIPTPAITQQAYRLYADGTESGSTPLAAQSTTATVDLGSGDANVGLRVLLQETGGVNVRSTDDWRLQWEKNASGTWVNVISGEPLADSYAESNYDVTTTMVSGTGAGQSFLGNGRELTKAAFWIYRSGSPSYTIQAELHAHTGLFGQAGGTATTPILATSTTVIAGSSLPVTAQWVEFDFDGTYTLVEGTPYVITFTTSTVGDASNYTNVPYDSSTPTHPGTRSTRTSGTWSSGGGDLVFRVYTTAGTTAVSHTSANLTDGGATTNRLTGGSGSFAAGEVSETGQASNLGWTASGYTELLYALTLKAADLADADTLRFRVLKNGATTGVTYTAVPTATASLGPATLNAAVALTATSTLTVGAFEQRFAAVAMTAASTLTAGGVPVRPVAVALTAASTLTAGGTVEAGGVTQNAAVAMVAASTLTTGAVHEVVAAAALTATSTLTTVAVRQPQASVSMVAASTLVAGGFEIAVAAVALSVTSTLTTAATVTPAVFAAVPMTAVSTLTVAATVTGAGFTTGAGPLVDNFVYQAPSTVGVVTAAVALTTTSTLTTGGVRAQAASAALVAASTLTAAAVRQPQAAVSLTATSTFTAAAFEQNFLAVALVSSSTLTTTAVRQPEAAVSLTTSSTLTTAAVRVVPAVVPLVGTSTLTTGAVREVPAAVTMSATSTLTTGAVRVPQGAVAMVATSTLTASAVRTVFPAAALTGVATLATTAQILGVQAAAVALSATSTLTSTALRTAVMTVSLTTTSTLSTAGVRVQQTTVALSASSTLSVTALRDRVAVVALTATATLTTAAVRSAVATVALTGTATLASAATIQGLQPGSVALTASSTLFTTVIQGRAATVALTTSSTLTTAAVRTRPASVGMSAGATLSTVAVRMPQAAASLTAQSTLTVVGFKKLQAMATLSALATLTVIGNQLAATVGVPNVAGTGILYAQDIDGSWYEVQGIS